MRLNLSRMLRHSGGWPYTMTPSTDQTFHQFLILSVIWTLLPNLTFYLFVRCFHRTFATGAASKQKTLTPPDTWSCPTLGLAIVLMLRPISPELVLFPDFRVSNIPRYFYFTSNDLKISSNDLKISSIQLKISLIHLKMYSNIWRYLQFIWRDLQIIEAEDIFNSFVQII